MVGPAIAVGQIRDVQARREARARAWSLRRRRARSPCLRGQVLGLELKAALEGENDGLRSSDRPEGPWPELQRMGIAALCALAAIVGVVTGIGALLFR